MRRLSIKELYNLMHIKYEWAKLTYHAAEKYDSGQRKPHPKYVVLLKVCLKLTDDQFESLIDAISGDYIASLTYAYKKEMEALVKDGIINPSHLLS